MRAGWRWTLASCLGVACAVAPGARAVPFAPAPARALHVTVALSPRDPAALAAYVRAVSTPGSPAFRRFLTPREFAARFGPTHTQVARVRAALRADGLAPGTLSAGGLSMGATGSSAALGRAAAAGRIGGAVVLGGGASGPRPLARRGGQSIVTDAWAKSTSAVASVGPRPCRAALAAAPAQGAYTDDAIASAYGFDGLYAAGDEGAGTTVAVYELESDDPADIAAFARCYGIDPRIGYVRVDGGAGTGAGTDEAALDIENLIAFAPRASVLVYQGPNSDSGAPGSGPYDVYSAIVNQDRARVVTTSWGECEAALGRRAAVAEHALFEQAAVQGQTIVAASGDDGSEDCVAPGPHYDAGAAVDDPAAQPLVTGVGGTSLHTIGPPPTETVWNSGGDRAAGRYASGAAGGGVSDLWTMPLAQLGASGALHLRSPATRGTRCGVVHGWCRAVPDVSADADPASGYLVYFNGAGRIEGAPAGWQSLGGTSAATPIWAALFTLADAAPACHGIPLGDADPALYRAASVAYAADFHDVLSGENDFTGATGGRFAARRGYDEASGLGTPDAAPLVSTLCDDALGVGRVVGQSSAIGARVTLRAHAVGVRTDGLRWRAYGLPAGLTIDPRTGAIAGAPRRRGRFMVRVRVRDAAGRWAQTRFDWGIGPAPRIEVTHGLRGSVTLTLRAVAGGPWVRGVRAADVRAATAGDRGSGPVAVRVFRGVATISPAHRVSALSVTLSPSGGASSLTVDVSPGSAGVLRVAVGVAA